MGAALTKMQDQETGNAELFIYKPGCEQKAPYIHPPPNNNTAYGSFAVAPTTPTAATRVFGTTELLESILIHLEVKDILRVRRVCRSWKTTFEMSPALKQKAFLHNTPQAHQTVGLYTVQGQPQPNITPYSIYPSHWQEPMWKVIRSTCEMAKEELTAKLFTPTATSEWPLDFGTLPVDHAILVVHNPVLLQSVPGSPRRLLLRRLLSSIPAGSIYSEMFLTQPPVQKAFVLCEPLCWKAGQGQVRTHHLELVNRDGIRMGDLIAAWSQFKEECDGMAHWVNRGLKLRNYHVLTGEEELLKVEVSR